MNVLASKLKRFADKDYRDGYLYTHVRASIAYQIKALRRKFGLTQRGMAERTNKTQSVISRLESDDYGQMSLQTLLDVASGLDVALVVRFVSYPDFLKQAANMSESALQPETINESLAVAARNEWLAYQAPQPRMPMNARQPVSARHATGGFQAEASALVAHNYAIAKPAQPEVQKRPSLSLTQQSYSIEASIH